MTGASPAVDRDEAACFHCGLLVPPVHPPSARLGESDRVFCCRGCLAVAQLIYAGGHAAYYERRVGPALRPERPDVAISEIDRLSDDPEFQRTFVQAVPGGLEAVLVLEGAHCAACGWLVEQHLMALEGVLEVTVGVATARLRVAWQPDRIDLSAILAAVRDVGYSAQPHRPGRDEGRRQLERRDSLRRLGVAGLGSMQVMMFAVAMYAGDATGMETIHRQLLRYASWLVTTVVVAIAARPFFVAAATGLRARSPGMDVPVALAITVAYLASGWATIHGAGPVYFESACMFTFLLGLTRHVEMSARHARDARIRTRYGSLPDRALRLGSSGAEWVAASALRPGDVVRLEAGDAIPADGRLREGSGSADESLWTGEAEPRLKQVGDSLIGGSRWLDASASMIVERVGAASTAARIESMIERAQLDRPPVQRIADRVAVRFVTGVLIAAAIVFAVWSVVSPDDALWITLSVLVASCPCALSLATPAALASASAALAERGFLICRGQVLETLGRVSAVVFDKTGTLTWPEHRVTRIVVTSNGWTEERILGLTRALERHSDHPLASAFRAPSDEPTVVGAEHDFARYLEAVESRPGLGVEARLAGARVRIGRIERAEGRESAEVTPPDVAPATGESWLALSIDDVVVGWVGMASRVRPDAAQAIAMLRDRGIAVWLASGDPAKHVVRAVAEHVGIRIWRADLRPDDKVALVTELQRAGASVAVVGDGRNDAPVLAQADVGIAMASGAEIARGSADAVVLGDGLAVLGDAWEHADRTRRIIRQNLIWAVAYNATVLPAAALGMLTPWMAALGMSASSILVIANSLRLRRVRPARRRIHDPDGGRSVAERPPEQAWVGGT
jgi:Cu2+-exporting ATPase